MKARKIKNALRKKAFSSTGTEEDRKAFHDALKTVGYLKKQQKRYTDTKTAAQQEKLYHANFWKFAGNAASGKLDTNSPKPTFTLETADSYYPGKYAVNSPIDMTKLNWFPHIPVPSQKQFDTSHVKPRDIKNLLRNKKSTSAPGEDNITYGILAKLSSTHHFLATLFSKLLLTNDPPDMWSSSKVILIHKKGDTNEPGNFRMIALTSCVGKLYHQLLANRIIDFLTTNKLLDPDTQKAFIPKVNGCLEHGYVLQEAIAHCRQKKKTLHCTFFDLADAFGSVNHELIEYTLRRNHLPECVSTYITNLYSRLTGVITGPSWTTAKFPFRTGTFQGDPLSPVIVILVFNPIIQYLQLKEDRYGYKLNGNSVITLPCADDFNVITSNKRTHQRVINELHSITSSTNLKLKPDKCKNLSIGSGSPKIVPFSLGGKDLDSIKDSPMKFFGACVSFQSTSMEGFTFIHNKLESMLKNI